MADPYQGAQDVLGFRSWDASTVASKVEQLADNAAFTQAADILRTFNMGGQQLCLAFSRYDHDTTEMTKFLTSMGILEPVALSIVALILEHVPSPSSPSPSPSPSSSAPARAPVADLQHFDPSELVKHEQLGAGYYGTVHRATFRGEAAVVKTLLRGASDDLLREALVLHAAQHAAVVELKGVGYLDGEVVLVMEQAECSLKDALRAGHFDGRGGALVAVQLVRQVAQGLAFLHAHGVLHRDVRAENILLFKNKTVAKLSDMGIARSLDGAGAAHVQSKQHVGPVRSMAPESLDPALCLFSPKSDVYMLGLVLYELLAGHAAFHELDTQEVVRRVIAGERDTIDTDDDMRNISFHLATRMWEHDVNTRVSAEQAAAELGELVEIVSAVPAVAEATVYAAPAEVEAASAARVVEEVAPFVQLPAGAQLTPDAASSLAAAIHDKNNTVRTLKMVAEYAKQPENHALLRSAGVMRAVLDTGDYKSPGVEWFKAVAALATDPTTRKKLLAAKAIKRMTTVLHGQGDWTSAQAAPATRSWAEAVANLTEDSNGGMPEDVHSFLLVLLDSSVFMRMADVVKPVLRAVNNLLHNKTMRKVVSKYGFGDYIVRAFRQHIDDAEVVRLACLVLLEIKSNANLQYTAVHKALPDALVGRASLDAGAAISVLSLATLLSVFEEVGPRLSCMVPNVPVLLKNHPDNLDVTAAAFKFLAKLHTHLPKASADDVRAQLAKVIVSSLQQFPDHRDLVSSALQAAGALSSHSPATAKIFTSLGICEAAVSALRTFPHDIGVAKRALTSMADVARRGSSSSRVRLMQAGACEVVPAAMLQFDQRGHVVMMAGLGVLKSLCSRDTRAELCAAGAIDAVVAALDVLRDMGGKADARSLMHFCGAVRALCYDNVPAQERLLSVEAPQYVLLQAKIWKSEYYSDPFVFRHAMGALASLCYSCPDAQLVILQDKNTDPVLEMATSYITNDQCIGQRYVYELIGRLGSTAGGADVSEDVVRRFHSAMKRAADSDQVANTQAVMRAWWSAFEAWASNPRLHQHVLFARRYHYGLTIKEMVEKHAEAISHVLPLLTRVFAGVVEVATYEEDGIWSDGHLAELCFVLLRTCSRKAHLVAQAMDLVAVLCKSYLVAFDLVRLQRFHSQVKQVVEKFGRDSLVMEPFCRMIGAHCLSAPSVCSAYLGYGFGDTVMRVHRDVLPLLDGESGEAQQLGSAVCAAVRGLCSRHPDARVLLYELSVRAAVSEQLALWSQRSVEAWEAEALCGAVYALCVEGDGESLDAVLGAGALGVVLDVHARFAEERSVSVAVLAALFVLTREREDVRAQVAGQGVVESTLRVMQAFEHDEAVARFGCALLSVLLREPSAVAGIPVSELQDVLYAPMRVRGFEDVDYYAHRALDLIEGWSERWQRWMCPMGYCWVPRPESRLTRSTAACCATSAVEEAIKKHRVLL